MSVRGKPAMYAQPAQQQYPSSTGSVQPAAPRYVNPAPPHVQESRSRTIMANGVEWHCNDCDEWEKYAQALEAEKASLKSQLASAEMKYSDYELERSMSQAEIEMNVKANAARYASKQGADSLPAIKDLTARANSLAVLALASLEAPMHIPTCEELSKRHVIGDEKKIAAAAAAAAATAAATAAAIAAGGGPPVDATPDGHVRGKRSGKGGEKGARGTPSKKEKKRPPEESGEESGGSGSASYSESGSDNASTSDDEGAGEGDAAPVEWWQLGDIVQALEPWVARERLHDVMLFPSGWVRASSAADAKGARGAAAKGAAAAKVPASSPIGVPAHACIITCRSRLLADAWFGETTPEGASSKAPRNGSGVMCVQTAYSRATLLALMHYLYTDRIPADRLREEDGGVSVSILLQLYHAAANYNLPLLRQQIQAQVEDAFRPRNALKFLSGANDLELKDVQTFALWFVTKERDVHDMQDAINSCDDVVVLRQTSKNQEENSFGPGKFPHAESSLREDLERLMAAGADPTARDTMWSDVQLVSATNIAGAHKVILAARCKVFEQELVNTKTDVVRGINDAQGPQWGLTAEFTEFLLRYLYTNTVRITPQANLLLFYSLTKMLGLEPLTQWITVCIQGQVDRASVLKILKFAHSHLPSATAIRLKQHCLALLERDCSIMTMYEDELRKLRDMPDLLRELISLTQTHSDKLLTPSTPDADDVVVVSTPVPKVKKAKHTPKDKLPAKTHKQKGRPHVRFADEL